MFPLPASSARYVVFSSLAHSHAPVVQFTRAAWLDAERACNVTHRHSTSPSGYSRGTRERAQWPSAGPLRGEEADGQLCVSAWVAEPGGLRRGVTVGGHDRVLETVEYLSCAYQFRQRCRLHAFKSSRERRNVAVRAGLKACRAKDAPPATRSPGHRPPGNCTVVTHAVQSDPAKCKGSMLVTKPPPPAYA